MSEPEPPGRLDPDRAIKDARSSRPPEAPEPARAPPVIDVRRYQWMIGGFGVVLLIIFSVYLYSRGGSTTPGVPAGQRLHFFVAPLAPSGPDLPANAHPRCNPAHPQRVGLNVCGREPIVLAFFAAGAGPCERQVGTLQTVSRRFPRIQFAAVAVSADRATAAKLVRQHHWTIPVAFDMTGVIGELYGISVCPIIELAGRGGVVARRLIGEHWESPAALSATVAQFAQSDGVG